MEELAEKYSKIIKKTRVIFRWLVGSVKKEKLIFERNIRRTSRSSSGFYSLSEAQIGNIPGPSILRTVAMDNRPSPAERFCELCG